MEEGQALVPQGCACTYTLTEENNRTPPAILLLCAACDILLCDMVLLLCPCITCAVHVGPYSH